MSINSMVIQALTLIVPVEPDESTNHSAEYATVNYDEIGGSHGDNEPQETRYLCQVHYYAPIGKNTIATRASIRSAIFAAGFTKPDVFNLSGQDRYADPVKRQHFSFEFEYAGNPDP